MSNIRKLTLDSINATGGTQSRAALDQTTVDEYSEAITGGASFPPVIVFSDGAANGNWLADGFHRFHAHRAAGLTEIACEVRTGTLRDAKLFAAGANGTHGLRRSNADKRRAVAMLLEDSEWKTRTEAWIANTCKVSRTLVRSMLDESHHVEKHDVVRKVERNGQTYPMDTSKIGVQVKALAPTVTTVAATPLSTSPTNMFAAAPAPTPIVPVPDLSDAHEPAPEEDPVAQLLSDYNQARQERDDLQVRVSELESLLSCDDQAAETQKWKANFEALSGRNKGLTAKLNAIEPEADLMRKVLKQIRQALGVERNQDILPALNARRAA